MSTTPNFKYKTGVFAALIILASVSRIAPHLPNFTPIAAMALFGGYAMRNRVVSILMPIVALFIGDCLLQFINHTGFYGMEQFFVYGSFILINLLGRFTLTHNHNVAKVALMSLSSSVLFYIITNFGTWAVSNGMYPHTMAGLGTCYAMGLSFFRGTATGDMLFNMAFYGLFVLLTALSTKPHITGKA